MYCRQGHLKRLRPTKVRPKPPASVPIANVEVAVLSNGKGVDSLSSVPRVRHCGGSRRQVNVPTLRECRHVITARCWPTEVVPKQVVLPVPTTYSKTMVV